MSQPCCIGNTNADQNNSMNRFDPPEPVYSNTKRVSPLDSLGEVYAYYSAEKANLIARTQHTDTLLAAALRQLQQKPHVSVCSSFVRKDSAVEATKLKQRNSVLAKKLSSARESSQALQKQVNLRSKRSCK